MNCHEVSHLLDSQAPTSIASANREAIDQHLSACEACREDWANWRDIAALRIAPMPADLGGRIAAAIPPQSAAATRRPARSRRPFVIGGLLIAGVAAAATIALQTRRPDSAAASMVAASPQEPQELQEPQEPQEPQPVAMEQSVESVAGTTDSATASDSPVSVPRTASPESAGASDALSLDPLSLVVLRRPEAVADEQAIAWGTACHDAIVAELRGINGLNVIAGASVTPYDGTGLSDVEVARALGAGGLLVVGTMNGCNARHVDAGTGERLSGATFAQRLPPENGWGPFARGMAAAVRDTVLKDPAMIVAEARATLLDATLSDRQRISALNDFWDGLEPVSGAFDDAVITAAVQIGLDSPDAGARASAWTHLGRIDDAALVEPLLQALRIDADEAVRRQAAIALNTFLDEPGVRDALRRAAAEDPSHEPSVTCCILTVREAADWASVADAELADWARGKLLDENLPSRSRLLPIASGSPDGRFVTAADIGAGAAAAIFEIGRTESNPTVRQMAWSALAVTEYDASFVPTLVDDLANHPDEYVRASAAGALLQHGDDPAVRTALIAAGQDPSIAVRRRIQQFAPEAIQP